MRQTTDVLVIGGGVAGLRAAMEAASFGNVLLLNKGTIEESASQRAQGGIAAVLNTEEEGGLDSHYQDTLNAGCGLCNPEAVRILVQEGAARVHELIEWGAQFDKIGSAFAQVLEGVHRKPRVLRAHGDATGREIVKTLIQRAQTYKNLTFRTNHFVVDLILSEGRCQGAWVLDPAGQVTPIFAQSIILTTGGAGQIFERTTNPPLATGDGVAMALRAGALVEDMEFVQFHPTSLRLTHAPPFLLSEAMRGEGARLINSEGKPFMTAYHPNGDLAPRDIVARCIFSEIVSGQEVFLDLTPFPPDFVRNRFPTIDASCRSFGLDMTRDPIPVAPAAHYMMGGVKTDLHGKTSIAGLWAAGEVAATGVHGANRLASNALLEGLVFGARTGRAAAHYEDPPVVFREYPQPPLQPTEKSDHEAIVKKIREIMWRDVGIMRSADSLTRARHQLRALQPVLSELTTHLPTLRCDVETRNMIIVAASIVTAAIRRTTSLGAHFRQDASVKVNLPDSEKQARSEEPTSSHISLRWSDICETLFGA